jgi:hypothetical protein
MKVRFHSGSGDFRSGDIVEMDEETYQKYRADAGILARDEPEEKQEEKPGKKKKNEREE